jgi:CBS domain-containing protein
MFMRVNQLDPVTASRLMIVDAEATPQAAALLLAKPRIGLVIVCHNDGAAQGVLSKSDLIRHLADPGQAVRTVSALMTRQFVSCTPQDEVHSTWQLMNTQGLQNLPVLDRGSKPVGVLDIRDAMKALYEQEELQEQLLANYVAGVGYQ